MSRNFCGGRRRGFLVRPPEGIYGILARTLCMFRRVNATRAAPTTTTVPRQCQGSARGVGTENRGEKLPVFHRERPSGDPAVPGTVYVYTVFIRQRNFKNFFTYTPGTAAAVPGVHFPPADRSSSSYRYISLAPPRVRDQFVGARKPATSSGRPAIGSDDNNNNTVFIIRRNARALRACRRRRLIFFFRQSRRNNNILPYKPYPDGPLQ